MVATSSLPTEDPYPQLGLSSPSKQDKHPPWWSLMGLGVMDNRSSVPGGLQEPQRGRDAPRTQAPTLAFLAQLTAAGEGLPLPSLRFPSGRGIAGVPPGTTSDSRLQPGLKHPAQCPRVPPRTPGHTQNLPPKHPKPIMPLCHTGRPDGPQTPQVVPPSGPLPPDSPRRLPAIQLGHHPSV